MRESNFSFLNEHWEFLLADAQQVVAYAQRDPRAALIYARRTNVFAEFLNEAPMHPDQIAFLNEVVDYLVKNGTMEPKAMFDSPFTNINDQGIAGIFDEAKSKKVIELIRHVNHNADFA